MSAAEWRPADRNGEPERCPKCRRQTEYLIDDPDGDELVDAERCRECGWRVDFTDDGEHEVTWS